MKDLFKVKRAAAIVSLPKESIIELLRHKGLITSSNALTQKGLESGHVTELRISRYEQGVEFGETTLRVTTSGVIMLISEVCHIEAIEEEVTIVKKEESHG